MLSSLLLCMMFHYRDVIMDTMASQITSLTMVYSTVNSGTYQRKHPNSASLAFVRWIHRGPVNSPHKWPVTWKMFSFDDVIMYLQPGHQLWRIVMMTSSNGIFFALLALCVGNSPVSVNSPHKGQWRGALMFSFICAWIKVWVNNRLAGDLRRHHDHYYIVMHGQVLVCFIARLYSMSLCLIRAWIND